MSLLNKIQTKLRVNTNYAGNDLRGMLGMNEHFFRNARGNRMLVYHGICKNDPTRFNSLFITEKTFEEHLLFYREYFNVISLDDYFNKQFSADRFNVCLSFDDGFANNYQYVLPLLEKYEIPASFFITGIRDAGYEILWNDFLAIAQKYGPDRWEFLGKQFYRDRYTRYVSAENGQPLKDILRSQDFDKKAAMMQVLEPLVSFKNDEKDYWLQMTEAQIRQLSDSRWVTIGCHGYYHNDLAALPAALLRDELMGAKQFLERVTARQMDAIAFPYGAYSRETIEACRRAGFKRLLAANFLFPQDHNDAGMRERFTINPYISVNNQMTAIIHGKYPR